MKAAIVDTETTGLLMPSAVPLEQQPRIIEMGIAIVTNGRVTKEQNWMIHPGCAIPPEITKITGITDEDVRGAPPFAKIVSEVEKIFKGCDFFVAHNAVFDRGMLNNELLRCGRAEKFPWPAETVCTVQEYVPVFGHRPKLIELYERILGKPLAQTHRALDDVHALLEVLLADKFFERIAA